MPIPASPPSTVLIVDDHASVREAVAAALRLSNRFGEIWECATLAEAVRLCQEQRPTVVVLDLMLPGRSEPDGVTRIRGASAKTEVLVYSGAVTVPQVARAVMGGAKGFVEKTAPLSELVAAIASVSAGVSYFGSPATEALRDLLRNPWPRAGGTTLTEREKVVLAGIAQGKTSRTIAAELGRSVYTVENHRRHIAQKTGLSSAAQLALFAAELGLIPSAPAPDRTRED